MLAADMAADRDQCVALATDQVREESSGKMAAREAAVSDEVTICALFCLIITQGLFCDFFPNLVIYFFC